MPDDRDSLKPPFLDRSSSDPQRDRIRRALLEAASDVIANKGLSALNLRRVADAVDVSTQMIYTMFGNKEGLLEALLIEGAERLYKMLDGVPDDLDERERLFELGRAYRRSALASPNMHKLIFSDLVSATERTRAAIGQTFAILVEAVEACVALGILRQQHPQQLATLLWTNVHGYVTLELTYLLQVENRDELFEQSLDAVFQGLSAR